MIADREQNEFNMAVSYLNRLNYLFSIATQSAMNLDAATWFHTLLALYRELSTEMKEEKGELKKAEQFNQDINQLISIWAQQLQLTGRKEISAELYSSLHNFELFLRSIVKKAGLQGRTMDDPARSLRGG